MHVSTQQSCIQLFVHCLYFSHVRGGGLDVVGGLDFARERCEPC